MPTALLLHAHPDDEVFANFGWAADLSSQGYDVVGAIATGGEASELHDAGSLENARPRRIAKYEAVLELLGGRSWSWLDDSAGWVDAPSGPTVSGAAPQHLCAAVEHRIARTQPDIVLTVSVERSWNGDGIHAPSLSGLVDRAWPARSRKLHRVAVAKIESWTGPVVVSPGEPPPCTKRL